MKAPTVHRNGTGRAALLGQLTAAASAVTDAFRRAAHGRLGHLRRGRLMLQLAYLASAEQNAIWDPYAWPPVSISSLSPTRRKDLEYLRALEARLGAEALRCGVTGGMDEALAGTREGRPPEQGPPSTVRTGWAGSAVSP